MLHSIEHVYQQYEWLSVVYISCWAFTIFPNVYSLSPVIGEFKLWDVEWALPHKCHDEIVTTNATIYWPRLYSSIFRWKVDESKR
jgi:quinol-cytochrome oxidoreductase complex cytochrome b subunit